MKSIKPGRGPSKMEAGKEELLKKAIAPIRDQYDYIIIDCPPSLGLLNTNALTAADSILIPVQCEYYALEGVTQLLITIRSLLTILLNVFMCHFVPITLA